MIPATKVLKEVSRIAEENESIEAQTRHNFNDDLHGESE